VAKVALPHEIHAARSSPHAGARSLPSSQLAAIARLLIRESPLSGVSLDDRRQSQRQVRLQCDSVFPWDCAALTVRAREMHRIFADRAARMRLRLISGGQAPEDLTWPHRLKILVGTSRGIEYLHTSDTGRSSHKTEVLYRDIKPSTILLDRDLEPRLSDVGLAREMAAGASHWTYVRGSP